MSQAKQCQYIISATGQQCKRNAKIGSQFCWQHQGKNINVKFPKSLKPTKSPKSPKSPKNTLNLKNLPKDIFTNLGQFLELKEIPKLINEVKLPENINLFKNCAIIESPTKEKLLKLYQIAPNLKILTLSDLERYQSGMYDEKKNYFDIEPIANFKKLEVLAIEIPSSTIGRSRKLASVNWNLLFNLKYLAIDASFDSENQILEMIQNLPKLEHLTFERNIFRIKSNSEYNASVSNSKTIEFKGESDWNFNFSIFSNVKRIINSYPDTAFLTQLYKIHSLEVLEISGTYGFNKSVGFNALRFPKTIKYLKISFDKIYNQGDDGILDIEFENLEFLELYSSQDLINAEIFLNSLRKIKYLYIKYIEILNDQMITILRNLKNNNPILIFGFKYTLTKGDNILLKSTFIRFSDTNFTPEKWLREHGYYIQEKCDEYIFINYPVNQY